MSRKRLIPVAALAALSAMAFSVPAAQADSNAPAVVSCAFTGAAGIATPGVQNIVADLTDGGSPIDTDSGTYNFSSNSVTCVIVDGGNGTGGPPSVTPVANASIAATGQFGNIICGTGHADGTATIGGGGYSASVSFGILFVAGSGTIEIGGGSGSGPNGNYDSVRGDGVVHIQPTVGNCVNQSVTSFDVAGAFEATAS